MQWRCCRRNWKSSGNKRDTEKCTNIYWSHQEFVKIWNQNSFSPLHICVFVSNVLWTLCHHFLCSGDLQGCRSGLQPAHGSHHHSSGQNWRRNSEHFPHQEAAQGEAGHGVHVGDVHIHDSSGNCHLLQRSIWRQYNLPSSTNYSCHPLHVFFWSR